MDRDRWRPALPAVADHGQDLVGHWKSSGHEYKFRADGTLEGGGSWQLDGYLLGIRYHNGAQFKPSGPERESSRQRFAPTALARRAIVSDAAAYETPGITPRSERQVDARKTHASNASVRRHSSSLARSP